MELELLIIRSIIILVVFGVTLLIATYSTYAERKVAAFLQDRVGPNRAGPFGLLQPLADAGKMFFKEEFIPSKASRKLFIIGPGVAMIIACMSSAVIPFGNSLIIEGREIILQGIEVNIGILYIFGVVSLGVYGIMIGGWASNNKFSLLGAIRAASQNISYELAMGLSIIALLMMSGTLSLREIALQQHGFNWNIWYQPLGFIIFLVCAFAETNRTPFDLPECETELVGGYHTEYSSMKLGLYLFAEYINIFVASTVMATLYFGSFNFPFMDEVGALISDDPVVAHNVVTIIGTLVLFAKIFFFIFFFMWVRWTLPRFRYDQLMNLGWKILIPLAILNIMLTGGGILLKDYLNF
ncbi:MAG: NADH-quinone oxidoreductase subunit NuoH [Hymenobacteraceae bacterium]|nr:NADH-quinone oxidoreductase subunit NuoH [Hymenobacteraceae bacterium]MDX5397600.1 NADH-quinone oxidoreductase subunit NuoH [Hymenobacteraceae bacterium]MDX5442271.1 NADH-quinone oxidoreductase subunit NuoH [Hymenobacteraceae bacterium]MDX5513680.1 NADH-quinone oxidoreductase subunit NuoH [Hymenobacteraceae bacterium]